MVLVKEYFKWNQEIIKCDLSMSQSGLNLMDSCRTSARYSRYSLNPCPENKSTYWWQQIYILVSQSVSSVAQSCLTLCDPMNRSTPGLPAHHQLPVFTQTHVHRVCDAIQPSHPLLSPSPPAPNPSQHQGLFQWVKSLHEVAKVLVQTIKYLLRR